MSILDLGFSSSEDLQRQLQMAAPVVDEIFAESGLADSNFAKLLQAGYSPKEIFDLTDAEMEALFLFGCQALDVGELQRAADIFTKLCQLDALDARFPFALGAALQLQGSFGLAAKMYLLALALNASRVDVYVRLGECLIAAGEFTEAREVLGIAITLAGPGDEPAKLQAESLLVHVSERADNASTDDDARLHGDFN